MTCSYYNQAPYRVNKVVEFGTDGTGGGSLNISYGYNPKSKYMISGGFNKKFIVGWAVDSVSGVAIGAGSTALIVGTVALAGISTPLWAIGVGVAIICYGLTKTLKETLDNIKRKLY